ncbi:hypothetical protein LUZ60_012393 [Juncus effusus]|nr:hypothetical protein LUZ60_012393 [Juncus effusus]
MNDLFSTSSFKRHVQMEDIESGVIGSSDGRDNITLYKFFEEVESFKEDLRSLEKLHGQLQHTNEQSRLCNEETKIADNAKTVKELWSKMDSDVGLVLRKVKQVKEKLEALDQSNAVNRKEPGCRPIRTRTSVVSGLGKKLKDLMDDFQDHRHNFRNTRVARCIERDREEFAGPTPGLSRHAHASSFVKRGTVELEPAHVYQTSNRKWTCIAIVAGAVQIVVILGPVILTFSR